MRGRSSSAHSRIGGNQEEDSVLAMEPGIPLERRRVDHPIALAGVALLADPAGALFWSDEQLLVVADLHLEKGSAFAKRGVLLPPYDTATTLARLARLIARYAPRLVIALGDSFHDSDGPLRMAGTDRVALEGLQRGRDWIWIAGNHDPELPDSDWGRFRRYIGARAVDVSS